MVLYHTDLSASAVQLFLNIPILVVQSSYSTKPTTHKKEWHCCAQEALDPSKQLDIHKYNIVIEDMISLQDNLKYSIESVHSFGFCSPGKPISQMHK